ncbi:hypothetical protein HT031_002386 [Scenedesmus sp. PABB004]|nr:hypothetical protein HT031_002386 [Scenedesmus sp. PABB004]
MPEVKRFFFDSVLKREYGDRLTVNFIPGAPPELVLFDAAGLELSRESVRGKSFDELHELVQERGFARLFVAEAAPPPPAYDYPDEPYAEEDGAALDESEPYGEAEEHLEL